jgi:cytochrome-b5 reductase
MEYLYILLFLIFLLVLYLFKSRKEKVFLKGGDIWQDVTLIDKKQISHDSFIFTFGLPNPKEPLGLPLGAHIIFRAFIKTPKSPSGELVTRKYTPTSPFNEKGKIELPIKVYYKNANPQFPDGGIMTQHLDSLKIGDKLEVSGPKGRLEYKGRGTFLLEKEKFTVKKIAMVAGGTGITPCFQLIQYIMDQENGGVELCLIYANKTEQDILLREKLEKYQSTGKFKVFYTLDYPPEGWKQGVGFVSLDMIRKHFGQDSETFVVHCGPPGMNAAVTKSVKELGFKRSFKF